MKSIEETLLSLKEQALEATKNRDANFYNNYLADNAIAVVPFGVFKKEAIVQQMASPNSVFESKRIEDTRVMVLSQESGVVTYKATFESVKDGKAFEVFVTTIYARISGVWKGVFYQQTPIQK